MTAPARSLALALLLPSLALAQPAPAAAAPAPVAPAAASAAPLDEATWSFGAGVGLSTLYLGYPGTIGMFGGGGVPTASVYVPTASVERRLAAKTWLVFGLTGGVNSQSNDPLPTSTYGLLMADSKWLSVSAGLRQVVWSRPQFEVSLLGLGELGVSSGHSRYQQYTGEVVEWDTSAWLAGASFGLAIDRELTPGLSVRLATPLLDAICQQGKATQAGGTTIDTRALLVSAVLVPRIELRLAF
jgi:hypothetical protein